MRSSLNSERRARSELDIPVKKRIAEAASTIFAHYGVRAATIMIAEFAHTNVGTVAKLFGTRERLVSDFLKSQMNDIELCWQEVEQQHPGDPEAQLRQWILNAKMLSGEIGTPQGQLSRAAAELISPRKDPLLSEIEDFWQSQRRKILRLCEAARFRDPPSLTDKLLLLVHGAFNERLAYGYKGPHSRLAEAGDDLMVAHGAQRKPVLEIE
jgi:AcrR family transcriptional regulator